MLNQFELNAIVNPHLDGQAFYLPGGSVGVLLSHGFGASTAEIRPVAEKLHSQGLTVSGPLLPGHMSSIEEINHCKWDDWTAAYQAAFVDLAANCEAVFIGGESMGGLLALYLAAQAGQANPNDPNFNKITGVITYAPMIKHRSRAAPLLSGCLALVKETIKKPQSISSSALSDWQGYEEYPLPAAHQLFVLQSIVKRRLKFIRAPILTIQGDQDRSVDPASPAILKRLAAATTVEIHWLEETGHCLALENQGQLAAHITLDFIRKHT